MKKFLWASILVCFCQLKSTAQPGAVTVPGSQTRSLHSSVINQDYELQISLPSGYPKNNKIYPVVYLMDSQWDFPLLTALYGEQYYDGFIPEVIIVGVTWGGNHPNYDSLRARDYTPTNEARIPQSGGAEKFLSFLKSDVFPFVESNYKADPKDRTLAGCSLGGLFTLYSLFTEPGLFQRYIATSPAFNWGNDILLQYEKKYAEKPQPPAKLFICVGGVERSVPGFEKFTQYLLSKHYPALSIQSKVLENTGHSGTKGEGYARGLQYVFQRPSLHLTEAALDKYAGQYQLPSGNTIDIKKENGGLVLFVGANNKYLLQAAGDNTFYSTAEFLTVKFAGDGSNINSMQIERYGGTQSAKKL